jgi:hypothetical protein
MVRILSFAAALATSVMLLSATASHAQAPANGYYAATPVDKPSKNSFLTRETQWKWANGSFVAKKSPERDIVLCSMVAQRAGKLASFSVAGTPVAAEMLEKCNARAG